MKTLSKTLLTSAMIAAGLTAFNTAQAVEWSLNGELAVELTDAESENDLGLYVTTTDLVLTISEKFGEVDVEGYIAYELRRDISGDADGLTSDGAGINVSGTFGSVFVGDDGSGLQVSNVTDVMYNNSDIYTGDNDITTNVIDYGFPLGDTFSFNLVVDISSGDSEDIDAFGAYGSYSISGLTFALGYTDITEDGAYTAVGDSILNAAISYEGGPISAAIGYETVDNDVTDPDDILLAYLTYTTGPVAITGYLEDAGDAGDLVALNVSYSFTDNFYAFFETAAYDDDTADNSSIGLVLTF